MLLEVLNAVERLKGAGLDEWEIDACILHRYGYERGWVKAWHPIDTKESFAMSPDVPIQVHVSEQTDTDLLPPPLEEVPTVDVSASFARVLLGHVADAYEGPSSGSEAESLSTGTVSEENEPLASKKRKQVEHRTAEELAQTASDAMTVACALDGEGMTYSQVCKATGLGGEALHNALVYGIKLGTIVRSGSRRSTTYAKGNIDQCSTPGF